MTLPSDRAPGRRTLCGTASAHGRLPDSRGDQFTGLGSMARELASAA
jgi:hypothetical protein